jgi:hypothetical protein
MEAGIYNSTTSSWASAKVPDRNILRRRCYGPETSAAEVLEGKRDGRKKLPLKAPIWALLNVVFGANEV